MHNSGVPAGGESIRLSLKGDTEGIREHHYRMRLIVPSADSSLRCPRWSAYDLRQSGLGAALDPTEQAQARR